MPKEYQLPLDESQVIFFAELIALMYCSTLMEACRLSTRLELPILPVLFEEAFRENLRSLLREPLRDSFFRKRFNEYFYTHSCAEVREVAWAWMQKVLVWEK
jgi:hypothetical protein